MLPGLQLNDGSYVKRLIRPMMIQTSFPSCNIKILNSRRKFYDVKEAFDTCPNVMIMVGKTGTGKTSLIDTITNHVYGVSYEDDFRYTLKSDQELESNQVKSQTKEITVYIMNNDDMQLGIIDTPGFGDTDDDQIDAKIPKMLKTLVDEAGHPVINGICFVVKGSDNRVGKTEIEVFKNTLKLFPNTAKPSTFACFTYCTDDKPSEDASNSFSQGIYGEAHIKNHYEFAFDNSKIGQGTKEKVGGPVKQSTEQRNKGGYMMNMESCHDLFKAMRSGSFSSKDMSKVIGSREEGEAKYRHIMKAATRTCELIVDASNLENAANAGTKDVRCKTCKTICCPNCTFRTVTKCDTMAVPFADVLGNIAMAGTVATVANPLVGLVTASIAFGARWLVTSLSDMECHECGHGSKDHERIDAENACPAAQEISDKTARILKTQEAKLVEEVTVLRNTLDYLKKEAWKESDITLESCKNEIAEAIRVKCSDDKKAAEKCRFLLEYIFNQEK